MSLKKYYSIRRDWDRLPAKVVRSPSMEVSEPGLTNIWQERLNPLLLLCKVYFFHFISEHRDFLAIWWNVIHFISLYVEQVYSALLSELGQTTETQWRTALELLVLKVTAHLGSPSCRIHGKLGWLERSGTSEMCIFPWTPDVLPMHIWQFVINLAF